MKFSRSLFLAAALLQLGACTSLPTSRSSGATAVDPHEQVRRMARGVNIIGYDPLWRDPAQARFKDEHFRIIHEGGFQTVRVNLHAFAHMDVGNQLDPAWMKTLDWVVDRALANHLMVILDLHNFQDFGKDPEGSGPKYLAFWRQVAAHFKDAPAGVVFELLNEPNGKLTPELWNEYLARGLSIVRESNPTRTVIIGPANWNGINSLGSMRLLETDRNLIVTVHYYLPMSFTHQGASWSSMKDTSGVTWGTAAEKRKIDEDFAKVEAWSKEHDRPILLGEFGAYDKGEMTSRARYTAYVARTAERLGWAWTYWQFDSDFIVYDIPKGAWVEPIHRALVP